MNTSHIDKYLLIGEHDKHWFHNCELLFKECLPQHDLKLICNLFAATSINTSLKSNITLFRRALYEITNNMPVGRYLPNITEPTNPGTLWATA